MYLVPGGVLSPMVLSPRGSVSDPGGVSQTRPPPVNRMTDRCINITLATTSLRPVIKKTPQQINLPFSAWQYHSEDEP